MCREWSSTPSAPNWNSINSLVSLNSLTLRGPSSWKSEDGSRPSGACEVYKWDISFFIYVCTVCIKALQYAYHWFVKPKVIYKWFLTSDGTCSEWGMRMSVLCIISITQQKNDRMTMCISLFTAQEQTCKHKHTTDLEGGKPDGVIFHFAAIFFIRLLQQRQ